MSKEGFAIWLTGIPASGKSSIARELVKALQEKGLPVVVLESDEMRKILTPDPDYSEEERDRFYHQLTLIGELIVQNGIPVIFDATANKRSYRDFARKILRNFTEVFVECPLEICIERDPKGIYSKASLQKATTVPGIQSLYEQPLNPEARINGQDSPKANTLIILEKINRFL